MFIIFYSKLEGSTEFVDSSLMVGWMGEKKTWYFFCEHLWQKNFRIDAPASSESVTKLENILQEENPDVIFNVNEIEQNCK